MSISVHRALANMIGIVTIAMASLTPAVAAMTAPADQITVAGASLAGSVQHSTSFSVTINPVSAPSSVKFVLDGQYLGQTSFAPFTWTVSTTPGAHKLAAHWNGPGGDRVTASFVVAGSSAQPASTTVASSTHARHHASVASTVHTSAPTVTAPSPLATALPSPELATHSVIAVSSAVQLKAALLFAGPGETIHLADGVYVGKFVAANSGTSASPITLVGSSSAVLTTGSDTSGYALHITGSYWNVNGISVTKAQKGIVLDGSEHTTIEGVDVGQIGEEGVHFRHNSSFSSIIDSSVHDTGLSSPGFGEGIYIGSAQSNWASVMGSPSTPDRTNGVLVAGNRISNTAAEGVDVKEGTSGGTIRSNVFMNAGYSGVNSADSWVDVKGSGYSIIGNSGSQARTDAFQVHQAVPGWGNNNMFSGNVGISGIPGYLVFVGPHVTGTIVTCQPTAAHEGLSNISCTR